MRFILGPDGLDFSPEAVLPSVGVLVLAALVGILLRLVVMRGGDEVADLWRQYGPIAGRKAMAARPGMPLLPWFCTDCHSRNGEAAGSCYKCGATREGHELLLPDAELPAGPSAGLSSRTRRHG